MVLIVNSSGLIHTCDHKSLFLTVTLRSLSSLSCRLIFIANTALNQSTGFVLVLVNAALNHSACGTICHLRYDRWPATDSLCDIWKHICLEPKNHGTLWRSIFLCHTNTLTYWLTVQDLHYTEYGFRSQSYYYYYYETVHKVHIKKVCRLRYLWIQP